MKKYIVAHVDGRWVSRPKTTEDPETSDDEGFKRSIALETEYFECEGNARTDAAIWNDYEDPGFSEREADRAEKRMLLWAEFLTIRKELGLKV